ncbi:hypothetical protein [Malaciobacter marinus]|uniref:hypothetical protein n=1 Tax=Malaciobacter marinus TaxID=505249 RepID=UPI003AFF9AEF
MIKKLHEILTKLYTKANKPFSGIGILICDDTRNLPISPLYNSQADIIGSNLFEQLLDLSSYKNLHHDGFHILSSNLNITHTAQYFYPKPQENFFLNAENGHGVRYFVAKIGSTLPNVKYAVIVGGSYGVCIFKDGQEIKVDKND